MQKSADVSQEEQLTDWTLTAQMISSVHSIPPTRFTLSIYNEHICVLCLYLLPNLADTLYMPYTLPTTVD